MDSTHSLEQQHNEDDRDIRDWVDEEHLAIIVVRNQSYDKFKSLSTRVGSTISSHEASFEVSSLNNSTISPSPKDNKVSILVLCCSVLLSMKLSKSHSTKWELLKYAIIKL
ncbi:hypothetical protein Syun_017075 [Stephania yunnanensis]|uniref:Uncharacterized protein n=1 Tax=Stephania yunnanensis TaxID=152371 RepID=A0AAP0J6C7_9MAGN